MQVGIDRRTGKLGSAPLIALRAEITAPHLDAHRYSVEKSGHVLANVSVTQAFAAEIRTLVTGKIGPDLPDRAALARATGEPIVLDWDELRESMKRKKR
jgi:hypothetical protein